MRLNETYVGLNETKNVSLKTNENLTMKTDSRANQEVHTYLYLSESYVVPNIKKC